ncbi:hypothetical protein TYRP_019223 [Tyrophagus putrescentiae]|nr:hypothetical protein TYRP_019223 [Tyrophagus putrescentiae]
MTEPAAHPDVIWLLSTPSSSGLARCARETLVRMAGKGSPRPGLCSPLYSLCFLTALQPRPKTVAASGQSLSQHSCRDSDTRARGSQSQRRIATDNVPNFLSFLCQRPSTRVSRAKRAGPEETDVDTGQVTVNVRLLGSRSLRSRDPRRRTLTLAKSHKTSRSLAVHRYNFKTILLIDL